MTDGVIYIDMERMEQIVKHNRSIEQDVALNNKGQLREAARALLENTTYSDAEAESTLPEGWDLTIWKRMLNKSYEERLVVAGALIAAEIDRYKTTNQ